MDKNREIKFFSCIGDPILGQTQREEEEERRKDEREGTRREMEEDGRRRVEVEHDNDLPVREQNLPIFKPKWDEFKNDRLSWRAKVKEKIRRRRRMEQ